MHTSDIVYNPDTRTITCSKSSIGWNSQFYSKSGYKDDVFVTFKPSQNNKYIIIGLDSNPASSSGYTDIDYCFDMQANGEIIIIENGTEIALPAGHTTYAVGDELRVEYSGGYVCYYHNGVLVRSVARTIGNPLYLDSSFYSSGSGSVYDVEFGIGLQTGLTKVLALESRLKSFEVLAFNQNIPANTYVDIQTASRFGNWSTFLVLGTYSGRQAVYMVIVTSNGINTTPIVNSEAYSFARTSDGNLRISSTGNTNVTVMYIGRS